jgi:hypothetical protein
MHVPYRYITGHKPCYSELFLVKNRVHDLLMLLSCRQNLFASSKSFADWFVVDTGVFNPSIL